MAQATKSEPSPEVPDRPSIAPNVKLSGEMKGAGFTEQQFLVQRDGRYLQITELLYHILEDADGTHTLAEIATDLSEQGDSKLDAGDVRGLIAEKLIPVGLVLTADGKIEGEAQRQEAVRSPLKLNLKHKVFGPEVIQPLTNVLKILYFPPLVIAMLLLSIVGQGWLFFVHGIAPGIHQMLYEPALMLIMLGIIVLFTGFHELGHATAQVYGGGEVRGMGVGFYLVYPAFYTDTTDAYTLGRWARVRTDLGGFYFNLIFALLAMAAYFLTHQEFLLVVVLISDLEIVEQLLPFMRLDGYWALADLTGIPDFFSDIVPFLHTIVPIPGWKGKRLPDLKTWVKAVFIGYILIAIPGMLLIIFLIVKNVPRVLITTWDSAGKQATGFSHASMHGDILGMTLSGVQLLLLTLPAFGSLFAIFNLGRTAFRATWSWGNASGGRRVAGLGADIVIVAFVAYLWIPQLPFGSHAPLRSPVAFQPISIHERGTIGDALGDVVHPAPVSTTVSSTTGASGHGSGSSGSGSHKNSGHKKGKHPAGAATLRKPTPGSTGTPTGTPAPAATASSGLAPTVSASTTTPLPALTAAPVTAVPQLTPTVTTGFGAGITPTIPPPPSTAVP